MNLSEIKTLLIEAHRSENWEEAKKLSQLKQKMKKKRYCLHPGCGIPISPGFKGDSPHERCARHAVFYRYYQKILTAIAALFCITSLANPVFLQPTNPPGVVTFAWDAMPGAQAYHAFYGSGPVTITNIVTIGTGTGFQTNVVTFSGSRMYTNVLLTATNTITISNLVRGVQYFFAFTQITSNGLESVDFSDEVSYTPDSPPSKVTGVKPPLKVVLQTSPSSLGPWTDSLYAWDIYPDTNQFFRAKALVSSTLSQPQSVRALLRPTVKQLLPPLPGQ